MPHLRRPSQQVQAGGVDTISTIYRLYLSIPRKWRVRITLWVVSFLFGLLIIWIWDLVTLLSLLIVISALSTIFNRFNFARTLGKWAHSQFLGRIRVMVIFAFLPAAWELVKNPSLSSMIGLLALLLVITLIWDKFEQIISSWGKTKRRSRPRR
ncbi:hypothetical protein ES707_04821 [subsurface metagenome]